MEVICHAPQPTISPTQRLGPWNFQLWDLFTLELPAFRQLLLGFTTLALGVPGRLLWHSLCDPPVCLCSLG